MKKEKVRISLVAYVITLILLVAIIIAILCVILKGNKNETTSLDKNDGLSISNQQKQYNKLEISRSFEGPDGLEDGTPIEIKDEKLDEIVSEIFNIVQNNAEFETEEAGGYFEDSPVLSIYLTTGEVMQVIAVDDFESNTGKINLMKVAYKKDWSDAKLYKTNIAIENTLQILYNQYMSNTDTTVEKTQNLDINSKEVQDLYNMLLKYNELRAGFHNEDDGYLNWIDASFYKDKKVTLDNLSNDEKMIAVLLNVADSEKEKSNFSKLTDVLSLAKLWVDEGYVEDEDRVVEIYTADALNNSVQRLFGSNIDISFKSLDLCGTNMDYIDGKYYKYDYEGGGLGYAKTAYSKIKRAEQQGDYIYIYDTFLYSDEEEFHTLDDGEVLYYTSSDETTKLNNIKASENSEIDLEQQAENILSTHASELNTYKHTFKKGTNGNYYWVSTEISKN